MKMSFKPRKSSEYAWATYKKSALVLTSAVLFFKGVTRNKDFCDQVLNCKRKLKTAPVCEVCLDSSIRNKRKSKVSFHFF